MEHSSVRPPKLTSGDNAGLAAYECSREFKALRVAHRQALGQMANAALNRLAIKEQALQDWYDDESKHELNATGTHEDALSPGLKALARS